MRVNDVSAFVLHQRPFGDSSRVVELFTEAFGRVALMAKGIRQAKGGNLIPFQRYRVQFSGRGELPLLQRAEAEGGMVWLHGEASLAGLYLNELLLQLLPRDDPHPELFAAYQHAIPGLAGHTAQTLRQMEWALLSAMGYAPDLALDVSGRGFDAEQRYELHHQQGFSIDPSGPWTGRVLIALRSGSEQFAGEQRQLLRHLLGLHLEGRTLKSWGMLNALRDLTRHAG